MVCAGFGRVRSPVSFTSHDDPPHAITWMHHWKQSFGASALYRITCLQEIGVSTRPYSALTGINGETRGSGRRRPSEREAAHILTPCG